MIKLLIVDDDADVCRFVKSFFETRNFVVFTALDGEEALGIFMKEKPHMVLIDVKMEGMDGITLLKEIKKIDRQAEAIMVSAIEDLDVVDEAKKYGASEYITKPLVLEDLEKVVLEKAKWIKVNRKI